MSTSPAKENILKKIRQALSNPVPLPFPHSEGNQPVFTLRKDDAEVVFAEEFSKLQGQFSFCSTEQELCQQLASLLAEKNWTKAYCVEQRFLELLNSIGIATSEDLAGCDISLTSCEYLVARTGTMVLSAAGESGRTASIYAPIHVCIAYTCQMKYDIKDALNSLKEKYGTELPSFISFASGPSRTADIEKTLVTGVHGPKEVYCFLVDGN